MTERPTDRPTKQPSDGRTDRLIASFPKIKEQEEEVYASKKAYNLDKLRFTPSWLVTRALETKLIFRPPDIRPTIRRW